MTGLRSVPIPALDAPVLGIADVVKAETLCGETASFAKSLETMRKQALIDFRKRQREKAKADKKQNRQTHKSKHIRGEKTDSNRTNRTSRKETKTDINYESSPPENR